MTTTPTTTGLGQDRQRRFTETRKAQTKAHNRSRTPARGAAEATAGAAGVGADAAHQSPRAAHGSPPALHPAQDSALLLGGASSFMTVHAPSSEGWTVNVTDVAPGAGSDGTCPIVNDGTVLGDLSPAGLACAVEAAA